MASLTTGCAGQGPDGKQSHGTTLLHAEHHTVEARALPPVCVWAAEPRLFVTLLQ